MCDNKIVARNTNAQTHSLQLATASLSYSRVGLVHARVS